MIIQAPHPSYNSIITLPNPELTNEERIPDQREYKIAMDKTVHSYVKRMPGKVYAYTFSLTREKGFELFEFICNYSGEKWRIIDHHDQIIVGYCLTNPNDTTVSGVLVPGTDCSFLGYGPHERLTFTLEIES